MGQDSSKIRWEYATMEIHVLENRRHFEVGDEIKGTVTLSLKVPINLYSVVLALQGKDCSMKVFDS